MEEGKPQRIALCISSYRRPDGLQALLGALQELCFEGAPPELEVIVVDNDAAGSARAVCEDARGWLRFPLRYVQEPRKGIPFGRNAAVAAASGSDWIAFVDDDETPEHGWLAALLRVQRATGADVVTGPVCPRFEVEPAPWLLEGGFFAQTSRATGTPLDTAFTNNVLVRTRLLLEAGELFDVRLTRGVGEDSELFSRLHAGGARIVWADEARVHERVPRGRARAAWLVRRGFDVGTATTHVAKRRRGLLRAGPHALAHGGWCVAKGLAQALVHLAHTARRVQGLELAGFGVGRLAGLAGVR